MTIADFQRHLTNQNCSYKPLVGLNITGFALVIQHNSNQRKHYFQTYNGADPSDTSIKQACDQLLISYPTHLKPPPSK